MTIKDPQVQNLTASAVQTQAGGTPVSGDVVIVSVNLAGDALTLAPGYGLGARVLFRHVGPAGTPVLFPPVGGTINGLAPNAFVSLAAGKATEFVCASSNGKTWWGSGISA